MELDDETLELLGYRQFDYTTVRPPEPRDRPYVSVSTKPHKAPCCGTVGCNRAPYGRQRFCKQHFEQLRRCKVDGCEGAVYRSSRCKSHQ